MAAAVYCALSSAGQEYVRPAVEFLKAKSKIPTFTGCLVHSGCDTSSRCTAAGGEAAAAGGGGDAAPSIFLNRPNFKGEPPIIYLLSSEKFEDVDDEKQELVLQMAAVLKDSGCALGTCNMQGSNVLHCAAVRGSVKLMRLVLEWQKEPKYALSLDEQNMEGKCFQKMLFLVSTMKLFISRQSDIYYYLMEPLSSTFFLLCFFKFIIF